MNTDDRTVEGTSRRISVGGKWAVAGLLFVLLGTIVLLLVIRLLL